jgi:hypothetical protein
MSNIRHLEGGIASPRDFQVLSKVFPVTILKSFMEHTENTPKKKNVFKSILAVVVGFLVVAALSVATDFVLEALGIFPPPSEQGLFIWWMLLLAFIYRSAYAVLGGYVTAMLAPQNPMKHVKILAIIGTIGGILGVIAGWNLSDHWYPIALAVTAYPLVWWGGKLRLKKHHHSTT